MSAQAPAGWYPDDSTPGTQRYWDGTAWTAHVAPLAPTSPSATMPTPPLASFGQRLGAVLVDTLVLFLPLAVLFGVLAASFAASAPSFLDGRDGPSGGLVAGFGVMFVVLLLAMLVGPVLYSVGFEGGHLGQTVGKWAVGIRVVDGRTAGRLPVGRAFARTLVRSFASGTLLLGYLWMLWDDQRRTWHDLAADSRVVQVDDRPPLQTLLRSWSLRG